MADADKWARRRKVMPPAAELLALVEAGTSFVALARRFDCTPATVRHRIRSAGLQIPTGRPRATSAAPVELRLLPLMARPAAWEADASCLDVDPELFHPETGGSTREGKALCAGCLVQAECLDAALSMHQRHGIWGGLSDRERMKVEQLLGGGTAEFRRRGPRELTAEETLAALKHLAAGKGRDVVAAIAHCDVAQVDALLEEHPDLEAAIADLGRVVVEARQLGAAPTAPPALPAPATTADVRAWALAVGLAVNPRGKVPRAVHEAYAAAHDAAGAA